MTKVEKKSLVIVYTGNGKGKTTAALGVLMRAWGRNMTGTMISFIKAKKANFGEHRAARKMGIDIIPTGGGFTWLSEDIERDKALAREGWELARGKITSGEYNVVVLDEITYPLSYGWLSLDEVIDALRTRPEHVHVIITGREAPQPLIDFADLVTEMRAVKHPFEQGMAAITGIDY